jgi:anaerobic magnesium-protoporphyrin IX monomethyl ester cyclase
MTTIAAEALRRGHKVTILDMSHRPYDWQLVREKVLETKADIVGVTATTPLMNQMRDISVLCKDISRDILVVGGGAHVSALPVESMQETMLDLVVGGEGDMAFGEICDGQKRQEVLGVYYRDTSGKIVHSGQRIPLSNLDSLAFPAWHLYDPKYYCNKVSRILVRCPPATITEFSRGCVYKCDFCASKITMSLGYRKKSPERCAEEVKIMYKLGWREFMLADDIFTSDNNWAMRVAEAIIRTGIKITWTCNNGIRVESANIKLFKTIRKAGCYRVSFGFESGNDEVLKGFGKGGRASLQQGRVAIKMARNAGIDTNGFFLLGLSADTKESMNDTIEFARTLELDTMLFGITIAFPGTKMFNSYYQDNLVRSFCWDQYHARTTEALFNHKTLKHETVLQYMKRAYRRAMVTNPRFIFRRLKRGIRTHEFFWDVYYGLKFIFLPSSNSNREHKYYARERWPRYNFLLGNIHKIDYQVVKHQVSMTSAS